MKNRLAAAALVLLLLSGCYDWGPDGHLEGDDDLADDDAGDDDSADDDDASDLSLELHAVCAEACTVRVRPLNTGLGAGPFTVEVLADGVPIASEARAGLEGGTRDAVLDLALDPVDVAAAVELVVRIDAGGVVDECDEANNDLALPAFGCP